MKKTEKQKKEKKGSLLVQIGTIFVIIFLFVILGFAIIQIAGNNMTYFEAKREYLTPFLKNTQRQEEKALTNLEWYVPYWRTHASEVLQEYENPSYEDDEEQYSLDFELITSDKITAADLEALPEKRKLRVAANAYRIFSNNLDLSQWQLNNEYLFIIDVNKDSIGFIYEQGDDLDISMEYTRSSLGQMMWPDPDSIPPIVKAYSEGKTTNTSFIRYDFDKDDTHLYLGFYPVVKNGKILYVIGIAHDWSEHHSTLIINLIILVAISIVFLTIAGFILLHFVNRAAVRPLKKIQNAVREYRKDKNTDGVIEKMDRIRARNELGELSDDVTDLVVELNRFNQENAKLIGDRKQVEAELSLASAIQNGVLPKAFPEEKDYQLFASMTPAKEVGGDFYDFFTIDDTHVGLAIGDVSGKGVPASLVMMTTKMLIKQHTLSGHSPAEVLKKTNDTICAENEREMFVTAWLGILDRTTGKIIASNAGHEYPILCTGDDGFRLMKDKHGFVLGGMDMSKYKEYEIELTPGSTLFLYSDGAPEATNASDQLFGTDQMLSVLNRDPKLRPEELCSEMAKAIDDFVGEAPQFDDLTMLCVRYNGWDSSESI